MIKFDDMRVIKTDIEGVVIIEPRVFEDARGYFLRATAGRRMWRQVSRLSLCRIMSLAQRGA